MKYALEVKNLTKVFGEFTAVDNVSFHVKEGEILGMLGPNGAGKTTIIQMLMSTMTPSSGSIYYFGENFFTNRSRILQRVTFASTYIRLPGRLTIQENLDIYGELYGVPYTERQKRIKHFLKFFDIWEIRNRDAGILSAGQISRVILAKAFLSYPSIVLLDEPTAALDPDIAIEVRSFIKEQQKNFGVSILLTSHNMNEVTEVCNRVVVLQKGSIIADNTPKQLAAGVKNVYLHLLISKHLDKAIDYLEVHKFVYNKVNTFLQIEIDEQKIASLLTNLATLQVEYDQISIDKPTLEDYFLSIAKKSRKAQNY